jgi:hypothetical protein
MDQAARALVLSEGALQQLRRSISDFRLIANIPEVASALE